MVVGTEFVLVRKCCAGNCIKTYLPYSSFHGSFIERLDQSIQTRMYRWMDTNKTERYIDSLESLLEGYNNCIYSTIGIRYNVACNDKSIHLKILEKPQKYSDIFT